MVAYAQKGGSADWERRNGARKLTRGFLDCLCRSLNTFDRQLASCLCLSTRALTLTSRLNTEGFWIVADRWRGRLFECFISFGCLWKVHYFDSRRRGRSGLWCKGLRGKGTVTASWKRKELLGKLIERVGKKKWKSCCSIRKGWGKNWGKSLVRKEEDEGGEKIMKLRKLS